MSMQRGGQKGILGMMSRLMGGNQQAHHAKELYSAGHKPKDSLARGYLDVREELDAMTRLFQKASKYENLPLQEAISIKLTLSKSWLGLASREYVMAASNVVVADELGDSFGRSRKDPRKGKKDDEDD